MASSVRNAKITSKVEVIEDLGLVSGDDDQITQKINDELFLHSASSPDAELIYHGTTALSSGTATLDLKALTDAGGNTISTDGKKLRYFKFKATAANANDLTLAEGASNGYEALGDGWSVTLAGGNWIAGWLDTDAPDVGDTAKNIDLSGTGSQSVDILLIFG